MVRVRSQLAIQASPELLARLRAAAAAQGRTTTSVAVEALEAWLAGACIASPPAADASTHARLEDLERRLQALEACSLSPSPLQTPPVGPLPVEGERLTTAELADRTGTNRGSWNNWAAGHSVGSIRHHSTAGSWRLAGKDSSPSKAGGPSRWLWEKAA